MRYAASIDFELEVNGQYSHEGPRSSTTSPLSKPHGRPAYLANRRLRRSLKVS